MEKKEETSIQGVCGRQVEMLVWACSSIRIYTGCLKKSVHAEPKIDHSRDTCMGYSKLGYVLRSTNGINPGCVVSSLPVAYESDGYGDGFFSQAKSEQVGIRPAMWVCLKE